MNKSIAIALTSALALVGCAESDEWDSQFQRDQAFRKYSCKKLEETPPDEVSQNLISVMKETFTNKGDRANLLNTAFMIQSGAIKPTCDTSDVYYEPLVDQAWEKYSEKSYGEEFKPSTAREAGINIE